MSNIFMSESASKDRIFKLDCLSETVRFEVKRLNEADVDKILHLCMGNPLFYEYHPPLATRESILEDMSALPPQKTYRDKYRFVGEKYSCIISVSNMTSIIAVIATIV